MPVSLEQSEQLQEIRLEGAVNIAFAAELKGIFLEALAQGKDLRLSLEDVTDMDVCILQLLLSASREWEQKERSFTLASPLTEAVSTTLGEAGFDVLRYSAGARVTTEV